MKMRIHHFIWIALAIISLWGCRHDKDKISGVWNAGPLKGYSVKPINGGAVISYQVPKDEDLLYVMAEYVRNGKTFTEKSSVYGNTLTIEGFNTTNKVKVKLYKVNKKGQKSAPVEAEFTPLESLIKIAQDSLTVEPGFGGVVASWANPAKTPLGIRLIYKNDDNELVTKDVYYSTLEREEHVFRGFESKETTFGISFEDKWGNISDTTYYTLKPFFEVMIPKPYGDMRASIPYDNATDLSANYSFPHIWNNIVNTSHEGWLTKPGSSGASITIDLKQVVKVSRIVIHGYHHNSPYGQVNIQKFELWGTKKIDNEKLKDSDYWLDEYSVRNSQIHEVPNTYVLPSVTFENVWQYLGFFSITRYDLMSPPDQQAILNLSANGMEYDMPLNAKPVRYIRLFVRQVSDQMPLPGNNYFSMGEITVYGDNTVPQD